jgi:hypothetical protein
VPKAAVLAASVSTTARAAGVEGRLHLMLDEFLSPSSQVEPLESWRSRGGVWSARFTPSDIRLDGGLERAQIVPRDEQAQIGGGHVA